MIRYAAPATLTYKMYAINVLTYVLHVNVFMID